MDAFLFGAIFTIAVVQFFAIFFVVRILIHLFRGFFMPSVLSLFITLAYFVGRLQGEASDGVFQSLNDVRVLTAVIGYLTVFIVVVSHHLYSHKK